MKKFFVLLAIVTLLLPSCQKINDRIDGLENRIDQIEETQIATINQQIEAINTTLPQLRETDTELKEYIQSLQTTATNLQEQITNTNKDIDELEAALNKTIADAEASDDALKAELVAQLNTAKADILAQLESTKTALEAELNQINSTIATLQAKDTELEGKITTLEKYVNTELQNTEDWATATFATLEQYNSIASDIATIKQNIESLNSSIEALEERLTEGITEEIAIAIEPIKDELVAEVISGVASDYMAAISTAKSEITAAYTSAIATSISNLESSMREWVNEQLTGYYTIAETDALLALLKSELEGDLASQKSYLEELINNLSTSLTTQITTNKELIDALRTDVTTAESNIATNAEAIAENSAKILANAEAIAEHSEDIAANEQLIADNKALIAENAALIDENKGAITNLEKDVAENVEAIAENATLIAQNATAINNNAQAISDNAAAIAQLRTDLATTKEEITEAYTEAITTAISTLDGELRDQIATEVATINSRIDNEVEAINTAIASLTERVATLEEEVEEINNRLDDIEDAIDEIKALDIIFDIESGVACMAGASIEFGYTIVGGDNDTAVECFGDGGWSADVISSASTGGRIQVTAPSFGGKGKVVVLATSGAGGTCMKSIRFDEGILTDILDTYEVDWEACTLEINPKTNIDYDVRISEDAQSWLSIAKTRAEIREDRLIFSVSENRKAYLPRTATIELIDNYGFAVRTFEIHQQMQPVEITLVANSTAIVVGETIEFTVLCENIDITSEAIIYDEYFNEIPHTYVPSSTGKYKFFSVYGTQRSTQITVSVLPCSLEIPIDTQPNNLSFNHRALAIAHMGINCPYTPWMKDNIRALDDSSYRYYYNIVECHGSSGYATNDPTRSNAAGILDDLQNPNGYPTLFLNLYNCEILNTADTSEFIYNAGCALDNCIKKEGADVGISMAVASLDDEVYCRANIKSAKHDEYRVNAWLLENNIAAKQSGAYKDYHEIHDHVLRNVSEEVCSEDFAGLSIGSLDVGTIYNYSCSIPITNASWDANNMEVLIVVCAKDENGMWDVANSAVCPVNSNKAYEYTLPTLETPTVEVVEIAKDVYTIQWNSISSADSYWVYVDGEKIDEVTDTYYTISNLSAGDHVVSVLATGKGYYCSNLSEVTITVEYEKIKMYIDISSTEWSNCYAWVWDDLGNNYVGGMWPGLLLTSEDIEGKLWYVFEHNGIMSNTVNLVLSNGNEQTYDIIGLSGVVRINLTMLDGDYKWTANVQSGSPTELQQ